MGHYDDQYEAEYKREQKVLEERISRIQAIVMEHKGKILERNHVANLLQVFNDSQVVRLFEVFG